MDGEDRKMFMVIALVVVAIVVLGSIGWYVMTYNSLVREEEAIDSQWAQVSNEYQRKIDLIPELVNAVEGYQEFESSTLENLTALRTQWMNAETTNEQVEAANEIDQTLKTILVTYESYPYLQSIELVSNLMYSLEGTENRIAVERMRYNENVQEYNAHIKSFPASMVAERGGFEERSYYESTAAPPAP